MSNHLAVLSKRGAGVAATALMLTALGACSSSSHVTSSPQSTAVFGSPKPASGSPITLGYVTSGQAPGVSSASEQAAVGAAIDYVNEYLGGIGGHPLKLITCTDQDTQSGATTCTNQMIQAKVPAVLAVEVTITSYAAALAPAGIMFWQDTALAPSVIAAPNAFIPTNAAAQTFSGPAQVAKQNGITHAAVFAIDAPGFVSTVQQFGTPIYKAAGASLDVVAVPTTAADVTPQVVAALSKKPGLVFIEAPPSLTLETLKALKVAGYNGLTFVISQGVDNTTNAAVPGGIAGVKELTVNTTDPSNSDFRLATAVLAKYAPGTPITDVGVAQGLQMVMSLVKGLSGITGPVTFSTITQALEAMPSTQLFLGGGVQYQCNRKAVPGASAYCSTQTLLGTFNSSGVLGNFTVVSPGA